MSGTWGWDASNRHVVVADRLDLFDANILRESIAFAKQLIQTRDDLKVFHARRDLSAADNVGENDGGLLKMVCDIAFPISQSCRNFGRKYFPQQILGVPLGLLDLPKICGFQRSHR